MCEQVADLVDGVVDERLALVDALGVAQTRGFASGDIDCAAPFERLRVHDYAVTVAAEARIA